MFKSRRLCSCPAFLKVTSAQPIAKGQSGEKVMVIQDLLGDLGYAMPKSRKGGGWDGIFGSETDAAIRKFQQSKGLKPDGMVGPKTLMAFELAILADPLLDLVDIGRYKASQLHDNVLPPQRRSSAAW